MNSKMENKLTKKDSKFENDFISNNQQKLNNKEINDIKQLQAITKSINFTDHEIYNLTGFPVADLNEILKIFLKSKKINYILFENQCISIKEQLIITLTIYTKKLPFEVASVIFKMPVLIIKKIFIVCTENIYEELQNINCLDQIYDFKKYKIGLVAIEIPIEEPENDQLKAQTLSDNSKYKYTFKCIVAYDELLNVVFCSDLHLGSTTARKIFLESNIIDHMKPEDVILVSNEFNIEDILAEKNIRLDVINEMNKEAKDYILTKIVRSYTILRYPMETTMWQMANEINFNCFNLFHLKKKLRNYTF